MFGLYFCPIVVKGMRVGGGRKICILMEQFVGLIFGSAGFAQWVDKLGLRVRFNGHAGAPRCVHGWESVC